MNAPGGGTEDGRAERRRALVSRLERLEGELAAAEAELLALGGEALPGLHLAVEVAGHRALLPAARVREIVPLLATEPVPGAPEAVLGTFVLRGTPVTVVDLARILGVVREPSLEAQIVVVGGARAAGILVDGVLSVEERALLVEGRADREEGGPFERTRLVTGLCRRRDEVLPLLHLPSILSVLEGQP